MHRWVMCVLVLLALACGGAHWHGTRIDSCTDNAIDDECVTPGTLLWAAHARGSGNCLGLAVAALPDGGAVATGVFEDDVIFGPGEAHETTLRATAGRNSDVFLAKYDIDGELVWAKQAGGPGGESPVRVAALPDGSVVIAGAAFIWTNTTTTFGAGEPNETNLAPIDEGGLIFVAKYDRDGALVWAKQASGRGTFYGDPLVVPGMETIGDVSTWSDGSVVITGTFNGKLTFGSGEAREVTLVTAGKRDVFIAKYDRAGSVVWATRAGGVMDEFASGVAALADGSAVITGHYVSQTSFGANDGAEVTLRAVSPGDDVFLAKYSAQGSLLWVKSAGGEHGDHSRAITALPDGNLVIAGHQGSVPAEAEPQAAHPPSDTGAPFHVAQYNAEGSQLWARSTFGSSGHAFVNAVAALWDGRAVVTGTFLSDATFGAGERGEVTLTAASEGADDIFVAEYDRDGAVRWALRMGTDHGDTGAGIAVARDGGVLVTGTIADGNFETRGTFANTRTMLEPGFFVAKLAP